MANEAESLGSLGEGGMSPDPEKIIEVGKEALGSLDNADPTMNGGLGSNNVSDTGGDSIPQGTAGLSNKALDPEAGAVHGIEAQPVSGVPYSGGIDTAPSSSLPSGGQTLKNLAAKGVAHTVNAGQTTVGLGIHGVQSAINGFGALGSSISGAAGGAISATTASVGTAALTAGGLTILVSQLLGGTDPSAFDANMNTSNCGQNVANAVDAANSDNSDSGGLSGAAASAAEEDIAKKIYSILKVYGLKNEAIAGVLGNLQWESGALDPTITEGGVPTYQITDAKKQFANTDINHGIGLMQWTGSRHTLLMNYAKSKNKDWWDVGLQLDFMMNGDDPSNKPALAAAQASSSPADAAAAYMNTAEHPNAALAHLTERQTYAAQWFAKMASWQVDTAYGQSIIGQASIGSSNASQDAVSAQLASCESSAGVNADNSSVVKAELSYAWPFRHQSIEDFSKGEDNRGTPLYQELHKAIWGSNHYESNPLSSCDNGVSTAIQWSGTDKDYKEQAVADQIQYLHTAGKANGWTQIQWGQDVKKLQPGDVFIAESGGVSHTFMYLGTQAPLEYYHNDQSKFEPGADSVSASHDPTTSQSEYNRSPGLNNSFMGGTNASGFGQIGQYEVWRHTGAPTGSKWTSFKPSAAVSS